MGAVLTPDVGSPILPTDPVVFDLTDATETLTSILIAVRHDSGLIELAHDGTNFEPFYASGSTRTVITDGYRYSLIRAGGWVDTKVVVSAFPFAGTGAGLINFSSDFGVLSDPPGEDVALSVTGVSAGTYGNSSHVGQFTTDSKGRLTAAASVTIILANNSGTTITNVGTGGTTATNAAIISDVDSRVATEAAARAAADATITTNLGNEITNRIAGDTTLTTNLSIETAARIAGDLALRTPKQFEHWIACVDQDGLSLPGNDTTGAIGVGVPGAQTRVVAVTGADSVVGSTHTWRFGSANFTSADLFGELVVGTATNAGKFLITSVVDAQHVTTNGTQTNETFSGATTLTVIGGKGAVRDAALTAAKLTPFKSLERLGQVMPRFGNSAWLTILVRPRSGGTTYTMMDGTTPGDMSFMNGLAGWSHILFRPTDNFVNDADDKIRCGYQIVAGTNASGYNATAGATKSNLPCQLAGGGAASIPLENFSGAGVDGITGKRIRFLNTTLTSTLRNSTSNVWRHDASSFVPGIDVAADPVTGSAGDVFVIEESAFRVYDATMYLGVNAQVAIVGVVAVGTVAVSSVIQVPTTGGAWITGCESPPSIHWGLGAGTELTQIQETYLDELYGYPVQTFGGFSAPRVGHGYRGRLDMNTCKLLAVSCSTDISDTPRTWDGSHALVRIGPGCFFKNGFTWMGSSRGSTAEGQGDGVDTISLEFGGRSSCIGNDGLANYRRLRIPVPFVQWALNIVGGDIRIRGVDISNCGSTRYPIKISGPRTCAYIDDVVSTDGNNGLTTIATNFSGDYAPSFGATVIIGTKVANTIASSGGDITLADGTIASFASLATGFIEDINGNRFIGTAGIVHGADSVPARSSATTGALGDVALTASTALGRDASGHVAAIPFSTIVTGGGGGGGIPVTGHAAESVLGNPTGSTGSAVDVASSASTIFARLAAGHIGWQTTAAIKTLLAISATSDISGLAAIATSGSANDLIAGTLPAGRFPALTGDVTTLAGALATTIAHIPFTPLQTALAASTGALSFNNQQLTNVADPTTPQGVATKNYVDTLAAGLKWKKSVRAISTTAGTLATDFAVGQVVDGVTLVLGDRIALAAQVAGAENGIYTVNASGAPTRATDADTGAELVAATFVSEAGTLNHDKAWVCTNDAITLGTTAVTIVNFQVIVGALLAINNLSDLTNIVTARTNLGLAAIAASGSASDLVTGTIPQAATAAETGDVTKPAGSSATTLANLPQAVLLTRTGALTASLPMNGQQIINAADPTTPQALATKHYVDASFSGGVPLVDGDKGDIVVSGSGAVWTIDTAVVTNAKHANMAAGTISSNLTGGSAAPADNTLAAVKAALTIAFADIAGTLLAAQFPALTGDVTSIAGSLATTLTNLPQTVLLARTAALTAAMSVNGQQITGLADPSTAQGAATKAYVDAAIAGLKWKQSVVCASTTNVSLSTGAQNGSLIDDITLTTGTRFALRAQTTQSENGIYTANASGAPTRATDADTGTELVSCAFFVQQGTINADKAFVCTQDAITLGTTAITFVPFASVVGALIAVNNLSDLTNVATARTNLGLAAIASSGSATDLIAGTVPAARMPAHTGDVTSVAGSVALTLANIPNDVPMVGDLLATAIVAPATPAAGKGRIYTDSSTKVLSHKRDDGFVTHTVGTFAPVTSRFVNVIAGDGTVFGAQPAVGDLQTVAALTTLANPTGSPAAPIAASVAQMRAMLQIFNTWDLSVSFGLGDGTGSESVLPNGTFFTSPFWVLPTTRNSDIPASAFPYGGASTYTDVNIAHPAAVTEFPVNGTFTAATLEIYCTAFNITPASGSPVFTLTMSKNGACDGSPISLGKSSVGSNTMGSIVSLGAFSVASGDRVGLRFTSNSVNNNDTVKFSATLRLFN